MKRRDLLQHMTSNGCSLREGGRHSWWHNPALGNRSAVPRHMEVNNHLARKICRDLGIPEPGGCSNSFALAIQLETQLATMDGKLLRALPQVAVALATR